jgi:hypothetical protein
VSFVVGGLMLLPITAVLSYFFRLLYLSEPDALDFKFIIKSLRDSVPHLLPGIIILTILSVISVLPGVLVLAASRGFDIWTNQSAFDIVFIGSLGVDFVIIIGFIISLRISDLRSRKRVSGYEQEFGSLRKAVSKLNGMDLINVCEFATKGRSAEVDDLRRSISYLSERVLVRSRTWRRNDAQRRDRMVYEEAVSSVRSSLAVLIDAYRENRHS